ncbi:hypothetical protein HGA02_04165 [Cellulomonas septica]|uniref:Uncharacterized protein n=2 Tax=Cellulomonas septica TaxID=285080 RepID=A0ABX1K183_9CELL|nr:hypothetical protein [Cellulomonas septica]
MGLRSRADGKIELDPIDIDWPYFTANNVRYHDRDLTVTWDGRAPRPRPRGVVRRPARAGQGAVSGP